MRIALGTDSGTLLARALIESTAAAGCPAVVTAIDTRGWSSATYVGARHIVTLGGAASVRRYRWLAALAHADLPVRGHIALPPAILSATEEEVTLEIITLEDH